MASYGEYVPGTFPPCTADGVYTEWARDEEGHPMVEYRTVNGVWSRVTEYWEEGFTTYEVTWHEEVKPHPATHDGHQPRLFTDMMEAARYAKGLVT